jgi:hypothetical protein
MPSSPAFRLHLIRRTQRPLAAIPDSAPAAAPETAIIDLVDRFLTLDEALHRTHDLLPLLALGWGAETPPGSDQATIIVVPSAAPAIMTRCGTDAGKLLHHIEHLLGLSRCKLVNRFGSPAPLGIPGTADSPGRMARHPLGLPAPPL